MQQRKPSFKVIGLIASALAASIGGMNTAPSGTVNTASNNPTQVGQATQTAQPVRAVAQNNTASSNYTLNNLSGGYSTMRRPGMNPKDWGMSAACARMVRHNRLRRAGLGGAHI